MRGYRIDIWDAATARWQSLCRRNARYELGDTPVTIVDALPEEESIVRLAATRSRIHLERRRLVSARSARLVDGMEPGRSSAGPRHQPGRRVPEDRRSDGRRDAPRLEVHLSLHPGERVTAAAAVRPDRLGSVRARSIAGNSLAPQTSDFCGGSAAGARAAVLRYRTCRRADHHASAAGRNAWPSARR